MGTGVEGLERGRLGVGVGELGVLRTGELWLMTIGLPMLPRVGEPWIEVEGVGASKLGGGWSMGVCGLMRLEDLELCGTGIRRR